MRMLTRPIAHCICDDFGTELGMFGAHEVVLINMLRTCSSQVHADTTAWYMVKRKFDRSTLIQKI